MSLSGAVGAAPVCRWVGKLARRPLAGRWGGGGGARVSVGETAGAAPVGRWVGQWARHPCVGGGDSCSGARGPAGAPVGERSARRAAPARPVTPPFGGSAPHTRLRSTSHSAVATAEPVGRSGGGGGSVDSCGWNAARPTRP